MHIHALALLGLPLLSEAYILNDVCSKQVARQRLQATKDCSSYLVVTSTAHQPITITRYAANTATKPVVGGYKRAGAAETATTTPSLVAVAPRAAYKSIPPYASSCKGPAAYSSACSCISVYPTTITVNVAPCTETVYKHAATQAPPPPTKAGHYYPSSVTAKPPAAVAGCPADKPNFALQAVGGSRDGQYVYEEVIEGPGGLFFGATNNSASVFHLTPEGYLATNDFRLGDGDVIFYVPRPQFNSYVVWSFSGNSTLILRDYAPMTCSLVGTGADITLSCRSGSNTVLQMQDAGLTSVLLGPSLVHGSEALVLRVHCRSAYPKPPIATETPVPGRR